MHPWKVDPMPIGQIFQFAMQAKAMRNAQQERAEERAFRERQQSFAEKSELAKLQFDLKKEQSRAQEAATGQAQEATKLAPERLSLASQHLKSYAENPTAEGFLGAVQSLKETGALPAEQLDFWEKRGMSAAAQGIVPFPADQAASLAAEFDAQAAAMVPPEEADPYAPAVDAAWALGFNGDVTAAQAADPGGFQNTLKRFQQKRLARGSTTVNVTADLGHAFGKKARDEAEEQLVGIEDTLYDLDRMKELATDPQTGEADFGQFVNAMPQLGKKLADVSVKLLGEGVVPEQYREQYQKMVTWRGIVDKYRSEEFRKLLGASQTATEIKNLADAVLSADMNSVQFKQAFGELRARLQRVAEVRRGLLEQKIDLGSMGVRERGAAIDKAMGIGQRPRKTIDGETAEWDGEKWVPVNG